MDIAKLAASSTQAQTIDLHGAFGRDKTKPDSTVDLGGVGQDSDDGLDWEVEEQDSDLRSIWHAAFTPVKPPRKVTTAPTGQGRRRKESAPPSGSGIHGVRGLQQQARASTALGGTLGVTKMLGTGRRSQSQAGSFANMQF
eukprot:TRINITY_DN45804_c0_g1_i1.p1 TRINITY_DN45804_c0_g1~~TRINITY_DN45804_c0_g1_i1.p1  ORF type:complete len:141 (+),score=14.85 TRINITY_DN45804_c0_g1_i1:290-712(+)